MKIRELGNPTKQPRNHQQTVQLNRPTNFWKHTLLIYCALFILPLTIMCFSTTATGQIQDDNITALQAQENIDTETPAAESSIPPTEEIFVRVKDYIPNLYEQLRYATTNNITGTIIYDFDEAYLRYGTVKKLEEANAKLNQQGYALKIWDAFRPVSAQFDLWEAMPDATYIANPNTGYSDHSRGNCIDLTLVDLAGNDVPMPTDFDDFSSLADRDYSDVSPEAAANAQILEEAMVSAGFTPYSAEWWHFTDETDYPVEEDFDPQTVSEDVEITISAIGDCVLATGYGFSYKNSFEDYMQRVGYDYDYFFEEVQSILASDDLTIANAENVFTTETTRINKDNQGDRAFWFKSNPDYAKIYRQGNVEAVNVANNHSHDYGKQGYLESLEALNQAGLTTFGYSKVGYTQTKNHTIAMVGINTLGPLEEGRSLEEITKELTAAMTEAKQTADIIIVSFHWGEEGAATPNQQQRELGHMAVDLGADLVLGHHPHVVQEVELYKEVPIAYSLGNFVFGGNRHPARDTMILSVTFHINGDNLIQTDVQTIDAYVYGEGSHNNYQPVLA